jgi:hypothetical protein
MNARSVLAGIALLAAACGGGGGGSSSGGGNPTGPSGTPQATTITINAAGVSQQQVRIEIGQTVQFSNNASRNVEIQSDPHNVHDLCPPLNVGTMTPARRGRPAHSPCAAPARITITPTRTTVASAAPSWLACPNRAPRLITAPPSRPGGR